MENMDKFSFPDTATCTSDTVTLLDLCVRAIAKEFSSYDHAALIADLPLHRVDILKSYMTPRMLHDIMPFLKKRGIDASYEWETFALRDPLLKAGSKEFDFLRTSHKGGCTKDVFAITERSVNEFHNVCISRYCEKLLRRLLNYDNGDYLQPCRYRSLLKQSKSPGANPTRRELLNFLPSVVCITINLDIFRKLYLEQEILNTLIENLETLKIGNIGFSAGMDMKLTFAATERISRILKCFCRSKVLKAIDFDCNMCYDYDYDDWQWCRENVSDILKGLDASENDEVIFTEVVKFEDDFEYPGKGMRYSPDSDREQEERAMDMDKIHIIDETWTDFQEILNMIKVAVNNSKSSDTEDEAKPVPKSTGSIEAVSLCINCFLHVGNYLPNWKTIRRLSFRGSAVRNAPSDGLAREILIRIACHQLTHLRLSLIKCDNMVARVLYIFHEYYREEDCQRPMEMLDLHLDADQGEENYPVFEEKVFAVEFYRGPCVGLDDAHFGAYLTFFRNNASLTHLELRFRHSSVVTFMRILYSVMESKVLQTLILNGYPIPYKDGINKADRLTSFLKQVKTLKKLSLTSCCIEGDTVRSQNFVEAIHNHATLRVLHLKDNDMGSAGAEFLTALLMPAGGIPLNLMELGLNCCNIPGEDLLIAAEMLKKETVRRPLIDTLNIERNMFKGDRDAKKEIDEKMKREYGVLAKRLRAAKIGYNDQYDPNSRDSYDEWSMDEG